MNIRELSNRLDSLVIFRAVLDDAVLARLRTALGALERGEGAVGALADFEAALFAHSLFRMYSMYAERKGWAVEVDSASETELGGIKEISFTVDGDRAYSRLKFESGVHRVQRVPETESGGRIHTPTATGAGLPQGGTGERRAGDEG